MLVGQWKSCHKIWGLDVILPYPISGQTRPSESIHSEDLWAFSRIFLIKGRI